MKKLLPLIFGLVMFAPLTAFAAFPSQSASLTTASSQYFTAASSVSILAATTNWSFEAWINPTTVSVFQGVFAITTAGGSAPNTANMLIDDGTVGKVSCQTADTTGSLKEVFSASTISAGAWTHVACTFDGSNLRIYINGVLNNTLAAALTRAGATGDFYLGAYYNGTVSNYFGGNIVLARWWSTVLSATDISTQYCTELGAIGGGLRAEWTLDNTLNDNAGNSNTLTNVNSATFAANIPSTCAPASASFYSYILNLFGDW